LCWGGVLYNRKDGDTVEFWRKKIWSLILPWIICSLITYLIKVLTTQQIGLLDYLKWVFGYGTWYYYSTVYLVCLIVCKPLYKKDLFLYIAMAITVVSLTISTFNQSWLALPFVTPYLNVLNWIGFFALGIMVRKKRWDKKLSMHRWIWIVGFAVALISFAMMMLLQCVGYFSVFGMLFELSSVLCLFLAARWIIQFKPIKSISKIGAYTYCIYLLHMPIVQPICSRIPNLWAINIFKPAIGLVIMILLCVIGKKICCLLPFGEQMCKLVGIRFRQVKN